MRAGEVWSIKDQYREKSDNEFGREVRIRFLTVGNDGADLVAYTYIKSGVQSGLPRDEFVSYFQKVYDDN